MPKKRSPRKQAVSRTTDPSAQRLNKILASAGLGSRRKVEDLIEQGRVEIDGEIVVDLASKVNPGAVKIKVDGVPLKKSKPVYFALNKPPGVLSTNYDPSGRIRVVDLVPDRDRVFSVGRLDQSSEGLMLLTNDGELAQRLAHPKFKIQKAYFVVVSGQITEEELAKLRKGVHLAEGFARIDGATIKKHRKGCTELEIVLSEGKNREIRRVLARAGHKVVLLRRIAIGPLRLGQMPVGASRVLTTAEVKALYWATDPANRPKKKPVKKKPTATAPKSQTTDDDEPDLLSGNLLEDADDEFFIRQREPVAGSVINYDDEEGGSPAASDGRKRASGKSRRPASSVNSDEASDKPRKQIRQRRPTSRPAKTSRTTGQRGNASKEPVAEKPSGRSGKAIRSRSGGTKNASGKPSGVRSSASKKTSSKRGGKR